ncbi:MAG TPA: hypothetical protein DCZ95_15430 [Verrucomicrobia bacterium]|nr:MAG: hypothetical protein A2X46_08140 [Lentisphaerae bacterium GWF2_57_35]HBA85477.1 hypothetical protein [Verrucomicrobiota bacterium]
MSMRARRTILHIAWGVAVLMGLQQNCALGGGGALELRNGYFWDPQKESYFIPHGVAYQTWNPPVYANQTTSQVEYDVREMKRMHVNSLRVEFTWSQIETNEGCYFFDNADFLINLAEELDMKLYLLIGYQYPPAWFKATYPERMGYHYDQYAGEVAISDVLNYTQPEAMAAYSEYVRVVCERYKDYNCIGGWILGNEFAFYDLWEPPNLYPNRRFLGFDTNSSLPSFQAFLTNRYQGDIEILNSTWDMAYADFTEIEMPRTFPADRTNPKLVQRTGYNDVIVWRQQKIAEFLSAGVGAAKSVDTNHLVTYAMVGGIFSGFDANNSCEDAATIVSVCAERGTPVDFWTINNYPWAWTGSEMRSMDYGVSKYKDLLGLPVMLSECGLSDNDVLFPETVYRQAGALASLPWEAIMSGAVGAHLFHWNDRNTFFSYDNLLKREGGFGMIHDSRLVKSVYWNVLDAYRRMDELGLGRLLPGSTEPAPDILTYWGRESDFGQIRYNQELAMIWTAFKRAGYQLGIIDEARFDAAAYTNAPMLFLPRNNQMEPQRLAALETNVLARGIHLLAEADFPGQFDTYYRTNSEWSARMASLFGLDVRYARPGFESGAECQEYNDNHRVFLTVTTNRGLLNTNFSTKSWKIWHGITNLDATVLATHTGETNSQPPLPAITVKQHGGDAWASFVSFAVGDEIVDELDSGRWEHSWDVRSMVVDAVVHETCGLEPAISLSGDEYARYILPDYRTCSNGSVLISLLNMNGPAHPASNLVVTAPLLLNGKKVENLTRGGIVTQSAGDSINVSLAGDEFLLLYAYETDGQADESLVNPNRGKVWFMNGEASAPTRVYPVSQWYSAHVGYDIPADWDWKNVRVGLERILPDGSRLSYGVSSSNWVAPGQGSVWIRIPVQATAKDDPYYISTLEGGRYVLRAWIEDMGVEYTRTQIPAEMFWGVKPLNLPDPIEPDMEYEIDVKWEDVPSYLPEEGYCPLNRARQWPLSDNDDVLQKYRVVLELMDEKTNQLASTYALAKECSGQQTLALRTPLDTPTQAWWRATLVAEPVTYDFFDSFEDRVPGNIHPWYINDLPMMVYEWGDKMPYHYDEGIGDEFCTHGKQSHFHMLRTDPSFAFSGHSYHWDFGHTNDYSSLSMRSNIWLSFDIRIRELDKTNGLKCGIELEANSGTNGKKLVTSVYSGSGAFETFRYPLSAFTINPEYPGREIYWSHVNGITISVVHSNKGTEHHFILDNVRLTGTPVRVGTGGMTNGIYFGNGDLWPGPDPDRPPTVFIQNESGARVTNQAPASLANGTDFGWRRKGSSWTNRFYLSADYDADVTISGVATGGAGAGSFAVTGLPGTLTSGGQGSNFVVALSTTHAGHRDAWLTMPYESEVFVVYFSANVFDVSAATGPAAGGNRLTITNLALGGASAVTNALVGGGVATILEQGDNWLALELPSHEAGQVDVVLQTLAGGTVTLPDAYAYSPAGQIGGLDYGPYSWTNLGSGMNGQVNAIAPATNGWVYAGGSFTMAGDYRATNVACWNGDNWTNLGRGLNGEVKALAIAPNGDLYAAGSFATAGVVSASSVARWDGTAWSALGDGLNGNALALAIDTNGDVYVGGLFTNAGGQAANRIAMWNSAMWTNLGSGVNLQVYSLHLDSNGLLYAGGQFTTAGGVACSRVACWDGEAWSAIGSSVNSAVNAISRGQDGKLFAGGYFTNINSRAVARVARWDGNAWTNMGAGMNHTTFSILAHPNGAVYAGGYFVMADGKTVNYVAEWDGAEWNPMAEGLAGYSYALAAGGAHELYVGGTFRTAGVVQVERIAKWYSVLETNRGVNPACGMTLGGTLVTIQGANLGNGSDITNVTLCGAAATGIVSQCATQVVVRTGANSAGSGDVAVYSASHGMTTRADAFTYYLPRILVLGTNGIPLPNGEAPSPSEGTDWGLVTVGVSATNRFLVTNIESVDVAITGASTSGAAAGSFVASGWPATVSPGETGVFEVVFTPLSGGAHSAALTILNDFTNYVVNLRGIGRYELSSAEGPSTGGGSLLITNLPSAGGDAITNVLIGGQSAAIEDSGENWVRLAIPAHEEGSVDIVVQYELQADAVLSDAYTYNPSGCIGGADYGPYAWTNMGAGMDRYVSALARSPNGMVYAGGELAGYIAQWNGSDWSSVGGGAGSRVVALAQGPSNSVYVGGYFTSVSSFPTSFAAAYVALWTGVNWTNLGSGVGNRVNAMAFDTNGLLYVGGIFTTAGGGVAKRVACWDGLSWTSLGDGVSNTVNALALDSNGVLYAGGTFTGAGGLSAVRVAAWNGSHWTNLGSGLSATVNALAVGRHGELYAGGEFTTAGGVAASRVAMWNGSVWTNLGSGVNSTVYALKVDRHGNLHAGGNFSLAGGGDAQGIARWNGTAWTNLGYGLIGGGAQNVLALELGLDEEVFAGGSFLQSGPLAALFIAHWRAAWIDRYFGVSPTNGPATGGAEVTIKGTHLGNGSDITNVTIRGVPVAAIVSQNATQLLVQTAAGAPGLGEVRVHSSGFGEAAKADSYRYQNGILVYLQDLNQTYNGQARFVSVTTDPSGLELDITYDGASAVPTDAGAYVVTARVTDLDAYGWAVSTLTVDRASQTISFPSIESQVITNKLVLGASADSGFRMAYAVESGPAQAEDDELSFTGRGYVDVAAAQDGNENWLPAADVTNRFRVLGLYTVSVSTCYGVGNLSTGINLLAEETILTNWITSPLMQGTTQFVCGAWTLSEQEPQIGSTNWFFMTVTNHASLTWWWTTNYWLETTAGAHGSVDAASGWRALGATASLGALADAYYHFDSWSGDVSGNANPHMLLMDGSKSVAATFTANLTTNRGLPEAWLAQYGLTNFEADVEADADSDRLFTWQEYWADTNPTNPSSCLRMHALRFGAEGRVLQWQGGIDATQYLEWGPGLVDKWTVVLTNPPPTPVENTITVGVEGVEGCYRLRVN